MSTTLFQHSRHPVNIDSDTEVGYNPPSALGLVMSFMLMIVGFFGLVWPAFFSLNLSFMHCLVLGGAGIVSTFAVLSRDKTLTVRIYYGLSLFFFLNAVLGALFGDPGNPRFAFYSEKQLEMIAPGFLELGATDHLVHGLISLTFLSEALVWKEFLKGHEVHIAQLKVLRKVAKYATIPLLITVIMIVVGQVQKSEGFKYNCETCQGRAMKD